MKRYLPFIIVGLVGIGTICGATLLYRAKRPHLLTIPYDKAVAGKGDTSKMHIRGNPDAPVTLEEFGDFECPPCKGIATFLDEVALQYNPNVRLIFRNFPLGNHKHAQKAAQAAEAAGLQGHFWEMHDLLYREQDVWSKLENADEMFSAYAGTLGLNLAQFKNDIEDEKIKERVKSDRERGVSLGVASTPTLFINNREVAPDQRTPEAVRGLIDTALKSDKPKPEEK